MSFVKIRQYNPRLSFCQHFLLSFIDLVTLDELGLLSDSGLESTDACDDEEGGPVPLVLCQMLQKDFHHPPFLALSPAFKAAVIDPQGINQVNCLS